MREKTHTSHEKHKYQSHIEKKKCKKKHSEELVLVKNRVNASKKHESGSRSDSGGDKRKCSRRRERNRSVENQRDRSQSADSFLSKRIKEEPLSDVELTARARDNLLYSYTDEEIKEESRDFNRKYCESRQDENKYKDRRRDTENKRSRFKEGMKGKKNEEEHDWGKKDEEKKKPTENIAKPDFSLSGKLAEDTNVYNGVVIKYSEPEEARKPKVRWRLYPFKGETSLAVLHLHRQSAYLIGRDRKIADLPVDHPSCSKQHAVLQYRLVPYKRPDGSTGKRVRPYIIDLESANGTYVNNKRIEARKYVELLERDVIKFAYSTREYVLLHEHSKDADLDNDVE